MNTEANSAITIIVTLTPRPDQVEKTRQALHTLAAGSRQEAGILRYDIYQGEQEDLATFHLVERYQNEATLKAHMTGQHYLALQKQAAELLARPPEIVRVRDLNVVL